MKAIKEVLNIAQYQYDQLLIDHYIAWCGRRSVNDYQLQTMMSNQRLFNWFRNEYETLELAFYDKLTAKKNIQPMSLYTKVMSQILGFHPPISFINKVKKAGIENIVNPDKFNIN